MFGRLFSHAAGLAVYLAAQSAAAPITNSTDPTCRYLPEDPQWPSHAAWDQLNATIGGRLIAGEPLAHVCHGSSYEPQSCAVVRDNYTQPPI